MSEQLCKLSESDGRFFVIGEFSLDTVDQLIKQAELALKRATGDCTFDFDQVSKTDSAGLSAMIFLFRLGKKLQKRVQFINLPTQLQAMAKFCRVDGLLGLIQDT